MKKDYHGVSNLVISSCADVQHICAPFFETTQLTYFNFVRIYNDHSRICLSNNQEWMKFVFLNRDDYKLIFERQMQEAYSTCLIWDLTPSILEDDLMQVAKNQFNITHGITLIERYDEYVEFCYFATTKNNPSINHFYVNNQDILHNFILYFKDKARKLITNMEKERFMLKGHPLYWLTSDKNHELPDTDKNLIKLRNNTLDNLKINRYYLSGKFSHIYFSGREAQCLAFLLDGKSMKEIANHIKISVRTVEGYVEDAKRKMGCNYKSELMEITRDCGFIHIYNALKSQNL